MQNNFLEPSDGRKKTIKSYTQSFPAYMKKASFFHIVVNNWV